MFHLCYLHQSDALPPHLDLRSAAVDRHGGFVFARIGAHVTAEMLSVRSSCLLLKMMVEGERTSRLVEDDYSIPTPPPPPPPPRVSPCHIPTGKGGNRGDTWVKWKLPSVSERGRGKMLCNVILEIVAKLVRDLEIDGWKWLFISRVYNLRKASSLRNYGFHIRKSHDDPD